MAKTIEHSHWPNAPDLWMPYAPAIKVRGGTTVYLAGVTAAPVYHHHPHRPEEFDGMPRDMEGQARAALDLKPVLKHRNSGHPRLGGRKIRRSGSGHGSWLALAQAPGRQPGTPGPRLSQRTTCA